MTSSDAARLGGNVVAEDGTEPARVTEIPDLPVLFGLRTPLLTWAFIALVVGGFLILTLALPQADAGDRWVQPVAFALLAIVTWFALRIPGDPLPLLPAALASVAAPALTIWAWWHLPSGLGDLRWPVMTTPTSLCALTVGLVVMRGRPLMGWAIAVVAVSAAIIWGTAHGLAAGSGMPVASRILAVLVPATAIAFMVRPMLALMGALRARELAAVRAEAAAAARDSERSQRLAELDRQVRPALERIASGAPSTARDVAAGRLLENRLRDEVRGRGWMAPQVCEAIAAARAAGAHITVFDDGGLGADPDGQASDDDLSTLRDGLLAALSVNGPLRVTARIMPPGRDDVAVITIDDGAHLHRRVCRRIRGRLEWSDGPAVRAAAS